ncbi:MAG: hypothetical protein JNM68_03235, partial [Dinghuibacter sp.]|nr:hypothetical protein [Dinghuibacter sp.]
MLPGPFNTSTIAKQWQHKRTTGTMNFRCSISLLLFLVFFARQSTAQEMSVIRYDERNGLTADVIYGIAQDKYGFLWLGTENGVFRFDGATFKKFSVEDGLTDNVTLGVHTSRNDHIFFEPFSGNPCYYRNGRFLNSESDTALRSLRMKGVNQYHYLEQENRLLFLQAGQNQYWHVGFNAGKLYTQHVQLPGPNRLITATPLKHHFLILSYYNDSLLCHFVEQDKPVHTTAFAKVTDKSTRAVALYHKGILYIGIGNTLYNCLWQPGKPIQVLRTTTYPRILKNFFPGSKGLYITFYQAGVYFLAEGSTPETLLPEAVVNHVFEDKDGNTWMGTDGKGLYMLKRKQVLNRSVESNTTTERAVILLNDKNGSVFCGYDNMTVTRFQNGQAKQFIVSES